MNKTTPIDGMTFEQALARLEAIVHELESGDASLENSIALYTEGSALKKHCEQKLKDAQARIERLQIDAGGQVAGTAPFDAD